MLYGLPKIQTTAYCVCVQGVAVPDARRPIDAPAQEL